MTSLVPYVIEKNGRDERAMEELYRRISDVNFKRISLILLGLSGVGLLAKVLLK